MSNLFKVIHNVATDDIEEVELSAEEVKAWELDQQNALAEEKAKQEALLKRQAILEKLGITEEEAKLLLS
jgi:hypothetical protein